MQTQEYALETNNNFWQPGSVQFASYKTEISSDSGHTTHISLTSRISWSYS